MTAHNNFIFRIFTIFLLFWTVVFPASATLILSYEGNNFTNVVTQNQIPGEAIMYDTSMKVTATFTLDSLPLPGVLVDVTPLEYSFSDGLRTLTNSNSEPSPVFRLAVDPTGKELEAWHMDITVPFPAPSVRGDEAFHIRTSSLLGDRGSRAYCIGPFDPITLSCIGSWLDVGWNEGIPGTWTIETTQKVSEPATLALFSCGFVALVMRRQNKKQIKKIFDAKLV
jgi:hypothetical protein